MTDETGSRSNKQAWPAIWRGMRLKCPNCGEGRLFRRYIEQVDHCETCREPLAYYRVGLFLPLILGAVVTFVIAVIMLVLELNSMGSPLVYLYVIVPVTIVVTMAILPSGKGAVIGLLWAKGWSDIADR